MDDELPLDTLNRLIGRRATVTIRHVEGTTRQPIRTVRLWTSTDDGTSWQPATATRIDDGRYRIVLPAAPAGTGVSLQVAARDSAGNAVDQTV